MPVCSFSAYLDCVSHLLQRGEWQSKGEREREGKRERERNEEESEKTVSGDDTCFVFLNVSERK